MSRLNPSNNDCEISYMYSKVKLYKQYLDNSDLPGCIGQYVFKVSKYLSKIKFKIKVEKNK